MAGPGRLSPVIRVSVNGYSTIGKHVADAAHAQPNVELIGVAKTQLNFEAHIVGEHGYPMYATIPECSPLFSKAGVNLAGEVDELIVKTDIIVDCMPPGIGAESHELYGTHHTPTVFQGGEDADMTDVDFNARVNFDAIRDTDYVHAISCNTTGFLRIIAPLEAEYDIEKVRATLVRRGGDPSQNSRGPISDILPNLTEIPSHHGPDVRITFPGLEINTPGLKAPVTLMHIHTPNVTFEDNATDTHARQLLEGENRIHVIPERMGIDGADKLMDFAPDTDRPRGDMWESCVQGESIDVNGRDLHLLQVTHQQSDVILENVDAIRTMFDTEDQQDSMMLTGQTLGIDVSNGLSGLSEQARAELADD